MKPTTLDSEKFSHFVKSISPVWDTNEMPLIIEINRHVHNLYSIILEMAEDVN
jgi:hypothetical protein